MMMLRRLMGKNWRVDGVVDERAWKQRGKKKLQKLNLG